MEAIYPPGPTTVPVDLVAPSPIYKRNARLAMLGLSAFIALYLLLSGWFAWTAWRLFASANFVGDVDFRLVIIGVCAAFLAIFMLKALFFIQHRYDIEDIEITRDEQPRLFEFIDRLADEAGAPRAHKVYLAPEVNAAVFYDLSLLNLIIPSKKNLKIGLGLVNVLNLGELKAVLAHEFGHFGQRSMAVGRWVYISQQIAGHIVARRDVLDKVLGKLSRLDLRVAWVGWLLSLTVWSIRSLMDILFRGVLIAQRALSRQMEYQADLVAVSLTGSDALIHALHRLGAADDAWDRALGFANGELAGKRSVPDLFSVQSRIIERMREILNQPYYGGVPPLPALGVENHRVFQTSLAQPPRMWMTHPPSADREANAKRRYVSAPMDERGAWALFDNVPALRARMSAHIQRKVSDAIPAAQAEILLNLDRQYASAWLSPAYRGAYLRRSVVRNVAQVSELYGAAPQDVSSALDELYRDTLAADIEKLHDLEEERSALQSLLDEVATAPGGIIRHRGNEVPRSMLPAVMEAVDAELREANEAVAAQDRQCRATHLAAARKVGNGWDEYLQGLLAALHYADHAEANLRDAHGMLDNIYSIVTADGRVSGREQKRLLQACEHLQQVLHAVHQQGAQVQPDDTLLRRLASESWASVLGEFELPSPTQENLAQWLGAIDSWVGATAGALGALRRAALEQLLLTEEQVCQMYRQAAPATDAPQPSRLPRQYSTLLPGTERPRQKKLDWWDRFQTADGLVPSAARLAVAMGIVGSVILFGVSVQ